MREITLDFAMAEVEKCTQPISDDLKDLYEKAEEKHKRVIRYAFHFFTFVLKYKNVRSFIEGAFFASDAFHRRDLERIQPLISEDTRVIDVGCGWGGFTELLSQHSKQTYAIDHVLTHAVATKILCPEARVFHGDAKSMQGFEDGFFDLTLANGVIEHVGSPEIPIGPSGKAMRHQFRFLRELSRITRTGGKVALSTGNYLFPRDGETDLWFFHWLPPEEKASYCEQNDISTDRYWLLTWEELEFLLDSCGLEVASVVTPDTDLWDEFFLDNLDKSFISLDAGTVQRWSRLVKTDPRYFSSWFLIAEKNNHDPAVSEKNNACYFIRSCKESECCDYQDLTRQVQEAREQMRHLKMRIDALCNSTSWKITAPLRKIMRLVTGKD